jgi:hypothetical protein
VSPEGRVSPIVSVPLALEPRAASKVYTIVSPTLGVGSLTEVESAPEMAQLSTGIACAAAIVNIRPPVKKTEPMTKVPKNATMSSFLVTLPLGVKRF